MNEPILEALTFSLESDLNVGTANDYGTSARMLEPASALSSSTILNAKCCVPCLIPSCDFVSNPIIDTMKVNESNLLEHLMCTHHLVIDSVEQIANIPRYFSYWRERFQGNKLEDFCVVIMMDRPLLYEDVKTECTLKKLQEKGSASINLSEPTELDSKKFYFLTCALPEDNTLRQKLWNDRLELVLEVNRREREQTDFCRQCLFCKEECRGNRLALFQHMLESHSFHIGKPDNVVFVTELIDYVEEKLNTNECIYCGKIFRDKTILREHMRKKQHKRINPSNRNYDKFYIINYLEPGKTWKALDEEDVEEERREEEWMEIKNEETSIVCLFCSFQNTSFDVLLEHMKTAHHFDFISLTLSLDFYQKVKLVNFIRRNMHLNICLHCEQKFFVRSALLEHLQGHVKPNSSETQIFPDASIWDRPEYFFPTYENDQFLVMLDTNNVDDDEMAHLETESVDSQVVIPEDLPVVTENVFLKNEFT